MADEFPYGVEVPSAFIDMAVDEADRHWYCLVPEVKKWVDHNCRKGTQITVFSSSELITLPDGEFSVVGGRGWTINFRDKTDAAKFKLFWC